MIWIFSNDKVKGYAPTLKKEYTEEEIRNMSFFLKNGWSKLSRLVMEIQGIKYTQLTITTHCKIDAKRLVDITTDFNFESCWLPERNEREKYFKYVIDVLSNLTLNKLVEYTEKQINNIFNSTTKKLNYIVTNETLNDINSDFKNLVNKAKDTTYYLKNLSKHFNLNDVFSNTNTSNKKDVFYIERKAVADFKLSF